MSEHIKKCTEQCKAVPKKLKNFFKNARNGWPEASQWVNTAILQVENIHMFWNSFGQQIPSGTCAGILEDENIHMFGTALGSISLLVEILSDRNNMKDILRARWIQVLVTWCHLWIWGQTFWGEDAFPCQLCRCFDWNYYLSVVLLIWQSDWMWFLQFLMAWRHIEFWMNHSIDTCEFKPWALQMLKKPDLFCQWLSQQHIPNVVIDKVWNILVFIYGLFPVAPTSLNLRDPPSEVPQSLVDIITFPPIWYGMWIALVQYLWKNYAEPHVWNKIRNDIPDLATTPVVGWIYGYFRDQFFNDMKGFPKTVFESMKNQWKLWVWALILWAEKAADWVKLFGLDTWDLPDMPKSSGGFFSGSKRQSWEDWFLEMIAQCHNMIQTNVLTPLLEWMGDPCFMWTPYVAGFIMLFLFIIYDTFDHRVTN